MTVEKEGARPNERQERLNRIHDAFLVIGWTVGAAGLAGVVLQTFMEVPSSEVYVYGAAMISSAISGGATGAYLNYLDNRASRNS